MARVPGYDVSGWFPNGKNVEKFFPATEAGRAARDRLIRRMAWVNCSCNFVIPYAAVRAALLAEFPS